ncbi:glycoside hydrolase family 5 protein [Gelatoporia subvermispora B]|uniref:Glycoside hydrolase family 5 protein n=1 Tax=Ceriporiopsis subvermispora (strain B) TaxID=914234 RepID=M2R067_CERS8|nr:glycoside hydrolase family 5 protein [Gelatoporia subvermispora B]
MHRLSKLFGHHSDTRPPPPGPQGVAAFPAEADCFRYRKQRGVNLGSWFVLERWIADSPFQSAASPAQSDLDVARGGNAKEILEHHWDTWITDEDWAWLTAQGINTVRIPVGFYHVCGADPSVLPGTDFADFQHVFEGAWARITGALVSAHKHGLGVLLDLHAAPGKQNADSHSGTSSPHPAFFAKQANMKHTIHVLSALLSHLTAFANSYTPPLPNLVGIELLNEPQPGAQSAALEKWYLDVFHALRAIDPSVPLYIGDSWMTDQYADFLSRSATQFAVLDHHLYRCFTSGDTSTSASEHARRLADPNEWAPKMFARVSQKLESAGCALVVGEWSGALNPGSLHGEQNEADARQAYVSAQLQMFERYCSGWFFWTYKKESAGDKGWSFRDAVAAGVFPGNMALTVQAAVVDDPGHMARRDAAKDKALDEHATYWNQWPGNYDHWRFAEGFIQGWDDAWGFLSTSASHPGAFVQELGFRGPWAKRRAQAHAREKGDGNLWEFEHGFSQGTAAARADFVTTHC